MLVDKPGDFHSLMYVMPTDGSAAPVPLNDGKSLDITPSFSPDGEQILFASDAPYGRTALSFYLIAMAVITVIAVAAAPETRRHDIER